MKSQKAERRQLLNQMPINEFRKTFIIFLYNFLKLQSCFNLMHARFRWKEWFVSYCKQTYVSKMKSN